MSNMSHKEQRTRSKAAIFEVGVGLGESVIAASKLFSPVAFTIFFHGRRCISA